jgi:hypothetical protein
MLKSVKKGSLAARQKLKTKKARRGRAFFLYKWVKSPGSNSPMKIIVSVRFHIRLPIEKHFRTNYF